MVPIEMSAKLMNQIGAGASGALKSLALMVFPPFNVLSGVWDGIEKARQDEFLKELQKDFAKIKEDKIDKEFILSDEFYDLCLKASSIQKANRSKKKASFICKLLVESVSVDRNAKFSVSMKESFLSMLSDMSDEEQIFLADFNNGKFEGKSRDNLYQELDEYRCTAMDCLFAKQILKDRDTWEKHVMLSMQGRLFIDYIKLIGHDL